MSLPGSRWRSRAPCRDAAVDLIRSSVHAPVGKAAEIQDRPPMQALKRAVPTLRVRCTGPAVHRDRRPARRRPNLAGRRSAVRHRSAGAARMACFRRARGWRAAWCPISRRSCNPPAASTSRDAPLRRQAAVTSAACRPQRPFPPGLRRTPAVAGHGSPTASSPAADRLPPIADPSRTTSDQP